MAVHQVSDKSNDDSSPTPGFERYRDFDDLPMDVDAGQDCYPNINLRGGVI